MRIYFNFRLDNGIKTENFKEEDIDTLEEKISKYAISSYELERLFFKPVKIIFESTYPVKALIEETQDKYKNNL
ncbi:hypothetical protein [Wukongibacter sp. M2B1]|uniref:hypothetical protein n=1 Tax=Wukongibacter sp. M2B1 TaxID=3088895 RepID=UPI003D7A604C